MSFLVKVGSHLSNIFLIFSIRLPLTIFSQTLKELEKPI